MAVLPPPATHESSSRDGEPCAAVVAELLAAHDRYPSLFEGHLAPKALFGLDRKVLRVNRAALALIGCTFEEIADRTYFTGAAGANEREIFERVVAGETATFETTVRHADGRPITLETFLFPALVGTTIAGVYASGVDVTERVERERRSSRRLQELGSLFERHTDAMLSLDTLGRCVAANPAYEALLGYRADELIGRPYAAMLPPDMIAKGAALFARALAGDTFAEEIVLVHRDGRRIDVHGVAVPIVVDGAVVGVYAIGSADASVRSPAHEQTEKLRELYLVAAAAGHTPDAQIAAALDIGRRRLRCAGAYVLRVEAGTGTYAYRSGDCDVAEGENTSAARALAKTWSAPLAAPLVVDGSPYGALAFVRTSGPRELGPDDREYGRLVAALVASALERGRHHRRLDALAFFDSLTGLPNRVQLGERIAHAISVARAADSSFAVHFYDLDGFKAVNTVHGHLRGDDVLARVGRRFMRAAGEGNVVARVGGDEFVIVQASARERDEARALADHVRALVAEPILVDDAIHRITASVGIAIYPRDGRDASSLLARADAALYAVKAAGRDAVAFVDG